jgi:pimeloyl-ACP methyl ester carboxylesterase
MAASVLLIPGLNNDARVWDPLIAAAGARLTVSAVDVPAISSLQEIADHLAREIEPGTLLVGHSFGGAVALEIAHRHAGLLSGLVLINAPTGADDPAARSARLKRASMAREGHLEDMAMARLQTLFFGAAAHDATIREERLRGVRAYGQERYYAHNLALADRDDRSAQVPPGVPILVVAASHDDVVPTADQAAYATAHGLPYIEIPLTAHMLPAEAPALLAELIVHWSKHVAGKTPKGMPL